MIVLLHHGGRGIACFILAAALSGCFSNTKGVRPSRSELHFPTAAHLTPGGRYLIIANSNFDLAWDHGTLTLVDLDWVESAAGECPSEGCEPFERYEDFILKEETVLLGSYASFMSLSPNGKRIYLTVRGTNSLTTVNLDEEAPAGGKLSCFGETSTSRVCDSRHSVNKGDGIGLPADPYAVNSQIEEWVFVSHLTSNKVSLFHVDKDEDIERDIPPRLIHVETSFPESVSSIKKHPLLDLFYATSRESSSVPMFRFVWHSTDYENDPRFYFGPSIRMSRLLDGNDARDIGFSSDGTLAFVSNRSPNSLVIADVEPAPSGWPRNEMIAVVPLDQGPSLVTVWEPPGYDGCFVYATCYNADRIYVVDSFLRRKIDTIATGDGPHIMVTDRYRNLGYIVNFIESTISVVDIDPASEHFNRIRATLGEPKTVRRND